jgi:hypothetical protein
MIFPETELFARSVETLAGRKGIMAHRHLVLAYVVTILGQIGYAGWVWWKYQSMRKLERQFPPYPVVTK